MEKKKEISEWPFTGSLGNLNTPLKDKNDVKCALILTRRFAEKLLFALFDPKIDVTSQDD